MDTYLNTLREHLLALAQNQQISKIEKSASRQDVWYSRVIQHQLRIGKVRSLPKSEFLPRQTSEILQDILPLVNFARNPKSTEILLHEIALIGGYLEKRQKWKAKKKVEKLTRIEAVVDRQTSLLQEISPKENIFREYF